MRSTSPGFASGFVAGFGAGFVAATFSGGGLDEVECAGLACVEHRVPITRDTRFLAASLSKQFTAALVYLLAAEGRLDLDGPVPDLALSPSLRDITPRQLLTHTSGLRDPWLARAAAGLRPDDVVTTADVRHFLRRARGPETEPGHRFLYCNVGYTLLALVVEAVNGRPFAQVAGSRLFAPLGMADTAVVEDPTAVVPSLATAYDASGGRHLPARYLTIGSTGVCTTVGDLALWGHNLATGTVGGPDFVEAMARPGSAADGQAIGYGFGLSIRDVDGTTVQLHGGSDGGYRAFFINLPRLDAGCVVLANSSGVDAAALATGRARRILRPGVPQPTATPDAGAAEGGWFTGPPGWSSLHVDVVGGGLVLGDGDTLEPVRAGCYGSADGSVTLTLDEHGAVSSSSAGSATYLAVEPSPPTAPRWVGVFHSDELDITYAIRQGARGLELHRARVGGQALVALGPDLLGVTLDGPEGFRLAFDLVPMGTGSKVDAFALRACGLHAPNHGVRFDRTEDA